MICKMCIAKVVGLTVPITLDSMCEECIEQFLGRGTLTLKDPTPSPYGYETIAGKIKISPSRDNKETDLHIFDNMDWQSAELSGLKLKELHVIREMINRRIKEVEQLENEHLYSTTELACNHEEKEFHKDALLLSLPPQVKWTCKKCGEIGYERC